MKKVPTKLKLKNGQWSYDVFDELWGPKSSFDNYMHAVVAYSREDKPWVLAMTKDMTTAKQRLQYWEKQSGQNPDLSNISIVNIEDTTNKNNIKDYHNSKNSILVGEKTNLLRAMKERYKYEAKDDEIYFFDNGYHFGTLFKEGSFLTLNHDGSLNDLGWRKS